jgi:hypothetical protein
VQGAGTETRTAIRPGTSLAQKGRCKATWKSDFKLSWREAGSPNHHNDQVDSDRQVVNKELSPSLPTPAPISEKSRPLIGWHTFRAKFVEISRAFRQLYLQTKRVASYVVQLYQNSQAVE